MKKVLLIATGGTIASVKTEAGLSPKTPPDEFLKYNSINIFNNTPFYIIQYKIKKTRLN